jgi:hypothetical protein
LFDWREREAAPSATANSANFFIHSLLLSRQGKGFWILGCRALLAMLRNFGFWITSEFQILLFPLVFLISRNPSFLS